jgi:cytochrome c biogenesis protein CcdA
MGFGARADSKLTGGYFILGRVFGVIFLGMVIALLGFIFDGITIYLVLIFGILTIIFGLLFIFNRNIFSRFRIRPYFSLKPTAPDGGMPFKRKECHEMHSQHSKGQCRRSNVTKKYAFGLGLFRGATPCLKMIVLAPLLIVVDLQLAFLMMFAYVGTSTIYPVIGHLTANIITKFDKYNIYIRITGAILLIILGIYSLVKILFLDSGTHFGV